MWMPRIQFEVTTGTGVLKEIRERPIFIRPVSGLNVDVEDREDGTYGPPPCSLLLIIRLR